MNVPDLELDRELEQFKVFTKELSPVSKGDAIANFDHVRRIHNSFSRDIDMLNVDSLLREKNAKLQKKQKTAAANASKAAKAAEKAANRAETEASKSANGTRRSNPSRRARTSKPAEITESDTAYDAFHFIAYMPIDDELWKLDGMDSFPQTLGKPQRGEDWLAMIQTELLTKMLQYQEGQIEFGLMAVIKDPITSDRNQLAQNIKTLRQVERQLNSVSPSWKEATTSTEDTILGMSVEYGVSDQDIETATLPPSIREKLSAECPTSLMQFWQETITAQAGCRAAIRDQMQSSDSDATKAMHRRFDYGAFVDGWLNALAEEDALIALLEV